MKVYVITAGAYSDYHICCVCLDKETAEKRARLFDDNEWDRAQVEEFDTDEYQEFRKNEDGEIVRCDGKQLYEVEVRDFVDGGKRWELGKAKGIKIQEWQMDETCWRQDRWYNTACGVDVKGDYWRAFVYARDEKEALRIAYDMIAKKKWEMVERSEDNG